MTGISGIVGEGPLDTFSSSLSTLVDEAKVHFEKNGIRVTAVDPANVGMVQAMLGADAFESWDLGDSTALIGLELGRLEEAYGFADSGEPVHLGTNPETRKLEVVTGGITHTVRTIDPESIKKEPDIPTFDHPIEVTLEGRQLSRAVRACDTVGDHLTLIGDGDGERFLLEAAGDDDAVDVAFGPNEAEDVVAAEWGDAETMLSADYLKAVTKPIPADAEVTLTVGEHMPGVLKWQYADGAGTCTYTIAPRLPKDGE